MEPAEEPMVMSQGAPEADKVSSPSKNFSISSHTHHKRLTFSRKTISDILLQKEIPAIPHGGLTLHGKSYIMSSIRRGRSRNGSRMHHQQRQGTPYKHTLGNATQEITLQATSSMGSERKQIATLLTHSTVLWRNELN